MFSNLKKGNQDDWAIALCYAALFLAAFVKPVHFEPIEFGSIVQILHPELPKGGIIYQPNFNYNYLMATVIRWLNLGSDWGVFLRGYWFVEMMATVAVLLRISGFVFKKDRLIAVIFVMSYIFYRSGELDPKTMALPLYFGALYCILLGRWVWAGIWAGLIFYLHIGIAVWLLMPSLIGLAVFGRKGNGAPFKSIAAYACSAGLTALPVIYYYLIQTNSQVFDEFVIRYYYFVCSMSSSVTLMLRQGYSALIMKLVLAAVVGWGCYRSGKDGSPSARLGYVLGGVVIVYFLNWILVDIFFVKTAIVLQLLRSFVFVQFFAFLFLAYFLSRQIRAGNLFLFVLYVLIFCGYGLVRKFLGDNNQETALAVLYVLILLFDILGRKITFDQVRQAFQKVLRPVFIAGLFCLMMAAYLPVFKAAIKAGFGVGEYRAAVSWSKDEYLYQDMAGFVNTIADNNVLVVYPFLNLDFVFFAHQKTFWDAYSPVHQIQYSNDLSDFKDVFQKDLHLSLDKIASMGFDPAWEEAWKNLPEDAVLRWHKEYGVTHIIREKELPFNFPVVYENAYYRLYNVGQ